jgi:hypothetical protein
MKFLEVTTKPIVYDADTGGKIEHFVFTVRTLRTFRCISVLSLKIKLDLKKIHCLEMRFFNRQDTIKNFSKKITAGKNAKGNHRRVFNNS